MATKKRIDILIAARERASRVFGGVGKALGGLTRRLTSLPALIGAALGGAALFRFAKSSIAAFGTQQKAVENLRQSLIDAGDAGASSLPSLRKYASALQEVTTQGDEATLQLAAYIAGIGGLSGKALQDATTATLGLARATGQGSEIMGRAMLNALQGNFSMLERYIPALRATESETEKMALVQQLAARGLRQMESDAGTTVGGFQQLSNAFGDMQEEIAAALEPQLRGLSQTLLGMIPTVQAFAVNFVGRISSIASAVGDLRKRFDSEFTAIKAVVNNIGLSFKIGGLTIAEAFLNAFDTARNVAANIGDIYGTLAVNVVSVYRTAVRNVGVVTINLFTNLRSIVGNFADFWLGMWQNAWIVVKNVAGNIRKLFAATFEAIRTQSLEPFGDVVLTSLTSGLKDVGTALDSILIDLSKGTERAVVGGFAVIPKVASDATKAVRAQLGDAIKELEREVQTRVNASRAGAVGGAGGGVKAPSLGDLAKIAGAAAGQAQAEGPGRAAGAGGGATAGTGALEVSSRFLGLFSRLTPSSDPQKQVAENTKQTTEQVKKTNAVLERVAQQLGQNQRPATRLSFG